MVALPLLLLSAGVNILQAHRIQSLLDKQSAPSTAIGKRVETINGFSTVGSPRQVSLRNDVPTLVYFFSPTCGWCLRNWPNVQALMAGAEGRYRVLAVSSARNVNNYLATHKLETMDTVEGIDDNTRRAFGFAGTPHTIVVSRDGVITHDWQGAYTPRIERQLEELFGLSLPGLLPAAK